MVFWLNAVLALKNWTPLYETNEPYNAHAGTNSKRRGELKVDVNLSHNGV